MLLPFGKHRPEGKARGRRKRDSMPSPWPRRHPEHFLKLVRTRAASLDSLSLSLLPANPVRSISPYLPPFSLFPRNTRLSRFHFPPSRISSARSGLSAFKDLTFRKRAKACWHARWKYLLEIVASGGGRPRHCRRISHNFILQKQFIIHRTA